MKALGGSIRFLYLFSVFTKSGILGDSLWLGLNYAPITFHNSEDGYNDDCVDYLITELFMVIKIFF